MRVRRHFVWFLDQSGRALLLECGQEGLGATVGEARTEAEARAVSAEARQRFRSFHERGLERVCGALREAAQSE